MIRDKKQIQEAMKPIRAFILDMDGTIYLGNALFPYTRSFLDTVKQSGRAYYFFTNNSSKDVKTYIDKLHTMGIDIEQRQMMISTHVILRWLKEHHAGKRVYVVGTPALQAEFQHHGWQLDEEHPDIVVLGFDTTLTYDKLSKACHFIREGAAYYGINPDLNCPLESDIHAGRTIGAIIQLIGLSSFQIQGCFLNTHLHRRNIYIDFAKRSDILIIIRRCIDVGKPRFQSLIMAVLIHGHNTGV